jgi:hypothetical protein
MNLLVLFSGGICLLTGLYGIYREGIATILMVAVVFGSWLIGLYMGAESEV